MTQRFILDENVVILALKQENAQGEPDPICRDLFTQIIDICHTIVVDPNLWNKYQQQLSPRSRGVGQEVFQILPLLDAAARFIPGKVEFRANAEPFPDEGNIPQGSKDDEQVVRLAVETGATLVTTDESLRQDLNNCGVQDHYHLRLLSPSEALDEL